MSEVEGLREALRWALKEGAKGFYVRELGPDSWYYCKSCRAVALSPEKLNHEDTCKLLHVKRLAAKVPESAKRAKVPDGKAVSRG